MDVTTRGVVPIEVEVVGSNPTAPTISVLLLAQQAGTTASASTIHAALCDDRCPIDGRLRVVLTAGLPCLDDGRNRHSGHCSLLHPLCHRL